MVEKVLEYIKKHNMLEAGHKVVVGVSGGADSLALIHILDQIRKYMPLTLYVAHVNHGLRGEAARQDAEFVEAMAREWGHEFFIKEAKVAELAKEWGLSEEEAGRKLRYDFFREVLDKVGGHRIALAHHRDDQAETILHNIIRGTGLAGLSGIKPVRDKIFIRPLLEISRKEIEDYCQQYGLRYRIDHTNEEIIYTRNRIRHVVIPMIEEHFNPNFSSSLVRMGNILREEEDFLAHYTSQVFQKIAKYKDNEVKISLSDFIKCHKAIQARLIRHGLELLKKDLVGIEHVHIEGVLNLAQNSNVGAILNLPHDIMVRKDYAYLLLSIAKTSQGKDLVAVPEFLYELAIPGKVFIPELGVEISAKLQEKSTVLNKDNKCIYIDAEAVQGDKLVVRNRRNGDRFKPLGMKGTKKLKDFFIDNKIPRHKRDSIPLVVDKSNIIWVVGHQINQDYRVTRNTKRLLKLEIKEKEIVKEQGGIEMEQIGKILIDEETIAKRVAEMGAEITKDYQGKELVVICILRGGVIFMSDLVKQIKLPLYMDFMAVSSYGMSTKSSGIVRILKDLNEDIEGKDVLIVEDIVDTGLTLHYLVDYIKSRNPRSVKVCCFLDKPSRRKVDVEVDYVGFEIPDKFVVGYGLDYAQKYRNLPYVSVLEEEDL